MHFGCFILHLILIICCIRLSTSAPLGDNNEKLFSDAGKITIDPKSSQQLEQKLVNQANESSIAAVAATQSSSYNNISQPSSGSSKDSGKVDTQQNNVKSNVESQALTNTRPNLPPLPKGVETRYNSLADSGSLSNKNDVSFLSNVTNHEGDGDSRSVKKDLNHIDGAPDDEIAGTGLQQKQTNSQTEGQSNPKVPIDPDLSITGFTEAAGVIFVLSLLVIAFIMYRTCKMKQHRVTHRYGGNTTTAYQELQPFAIEDDDSEAEEQALFDLQKARSSQAVL